MRHLQSFSKRRPQRGRMSTLLVAVAAVVVASLIPDDAALAQRLAARLEKTLGVPVTVGSLHWQLLPHAQITVTDIVAAPTKQQVSDAITQGAKSAADEAQRSAGSPSGPSASSTPATPPDASELSAEIQTITLRPRLWPLLHHEVGFDQVTVQGARVPQLLVGAISGRGGNGNAAGSTSSGWHAAPEALSHFDFQDVVWIGRHGKKVPYAGTVEFDPAWRPHHLELTRTKAEPKAQLILDRQKNEDRWAAKIAIAGGSLDGTVTLTAPDGAASQPAQPGQDSAAGKSADSSKSSIGNSKAAWQIGGDFVPKNIDVAQLLATFDHKSAVSGKLNGSTHLQSQADTAGGLLGGLTTRTQFHIAPAKILHFDLNKEIHSLGKHHDGTTDLQVLEGTLATRNSPSGMVLHYTDLHATSGDLSARGEATLQDQHINAQFSVDLVDGLVGIPLKVTGPVSHPDFDVPASAVAGAVAGTAVLPGIGTAIGARIGAMLGKVFGGGDATPAQPPAGRNPPPGSHR
jgi:hypothetical protein